MTTRLGDSDSFCFGDCEYIEGMTLTQHLNQMKLSAFVAIAAVIGGSFLIPNPAEARNGWRRGYTANDGSTTYFKVINRSSNLVTYLERSSADKFEFTSTANCSTWSVKYSDQSTWKPVMPQSNGEVMMNMLCR